VYLGAYRRLASGEIPMGEYNRAPLRGDTDVLAKRIGARIVDALVEALGILIIVFGIAIIGYTIHAYKPSFLIGVIVASLFVLAYELLLEGLWNGQTVGKRLLNIQVLMDDGRTCTLTASVVRNLLVVVDGLILYAIAFLSIWKSPLRKRVGDRVAHTVVAHTEPTAAPQATDNTPEPESTSPSSTAIDQSTPTTTSSQQVDPLTSGRSRTETSTSGRMGESAEKITRARQAITATIADEAAESGWVEAVLNRLTNLSTAYERWLTENADNQSQIDLWAAELSGWFRARESRFHSVREDINQARHEESWDLYLARITIYSALTALGGIIAGILLSLLFATTGVFAAIHPQVAAPQNVSSFADHYRVILGGGLLTLFLGGISGSIVFALLYFAPRIQKDTRSREVTHILPYGVTYMYALSRGNMPLVQIVQQVADSTGPYGAFASECQLIVREMEYFGRDLQAAMRHTRANTPSPEFAALLNDLGTVFHASQSVTPFLRDKTEEFHERAHQAQEDFLDTLEILAELYLIAMVLGTLLLTTIFVVMGTINPGTTFFLYPIIYIFIPGGTIAFYVIIDALSVDEAETIDVTLPTTVDPITTTDLDEEASTLKEARTSSTRNTDRRGTAATDGGMITPPAAGNTRSFTENLHLIEGLASAKRRQRVLELLRYPFDHPYEQPLAALGWSLPLAVLVELLILATGTAHLSGLTNAPLWATTILGVVPLFISIGPVTYYHEVSSRRQKHINKELPTAVRQLASANEAGMSINESIAVVGETSSGLLADEFSRLSHALTWNLEFSDGLAELANRLRNPRFTRVASLLIQANTATNDVRDVLNAIETDVQNAADLDKEHSQRMFLYVFMAVIGFGVFLVINAFLYSTLLTQVAHVQSASAASKLGSQLNGAAFGSNFQLTKYRMLFFHATLIQAVATGIMGGKLATGDGKSGLKYALGQVIVTVIVFFLI